MCTVAGAAEDMKEPHLTDEMVKRDNVFSGMEVPLYSMSPAVSFRSVSLAR